MAAYERHQANPIDISIFGNKELERALAQFEPKVQKRVVRRVLRRSAERIKLAVMLNWSGRVVQEDTGKTVDAIEAKSIKFERGGRFGLRAVWYLPRRDELGIPEWPYEWYYPFAVEYGYTRTARAPVTVPPKPPIRRAVNDNMEREHARMERDLGKGIEREARKAFKKVRAA